MSEHLNLYTNQPGSLDKSAEVAHPDFAPGDTVTVAVRIKSVRHFLAAKVQSKVEPTYEGQSRRYVVDFGLSTAVVPQARLRHATEVPAQTIVSDVDPGEGYSYDGFVEPWDGSDPKA